MKYSLPTTKSAIGMIAALLAFACMAGSVSAASSWNPTLLVNTEAFQVIDEGAGGSTNIEIRFGQTLNEKLFYDRTNNRFTFSRGLFVGGNLTATGSLSVKNVMSGSALRVDRNADIWGTLSASGALKIGGTSTFTGQTVHNAGVKVRGNLSGSTLNVDGYASFNAGLTASGTIAGKGNLTINSDNDTNDAIVTFGNNTLAQTLQFKNTAQRFEFSKDLKVAGSLSGSTLIIDGNMTLHGVTYSFPTAQGAGNTYLRNDGAGNLTWATTTVGNGSGSEVSMHPQYPNAVYAQSGSTAVGTLTQGADTTNNELFYRWSTTQGTLQDYWIYARVKVPKNFSNWTGNAIQIRYRTNTTSAANNYLTARLIDTTGASVALTSNANLVSGVANTWTTATLGGVTSGTYAGDGYITLLLKLASTTTNFADVGYINLNWSTTTP